MNQIILDRRIQPPIRLADVEGLKQQADWCLRQHHVRHVLSFLNADGVRLICAFEAPDAEALRSVLRQLNEPYENLWASTVLGPPSLAVTAALPTDDETLVVVERSFVDPVDFEALQAQEDRAAWCLKEHRVRFLRTYFSLDRRRMICVYAAPDAESVRLAQNKAAMPMDAAWAAAIYQSRPT